MAYLHQGHADYPMRLGHEWCGTVVGVGDGVDAGWVGRRDDRGHDARLRPMRRVPTGAATCARTGSRSGSAAAGRARSPSSCVVPVDRAASVCPTPSTMSPARSSSRAATRCARCGRRASPRRRAADPRPGHDRPARRAVRPGRRRRGPHHGPLGAVARLRPGLGFHGVWTAETLPRCRATRSIDASNDRRLPALALDLVEPGRRVVYIGLAGVPA